MNRNPQSGSRRRLLVALPAIALAAASLTVTGSAAAQTSGGARATIGADDYYINYAEPEVQPDTPGKEVKGKDGVFTSPVDAARAYDRKFAGGNPKAARELAKLEAKAIKTGQSPRQIKQAKGTQTAKLLTLLVEFNDKANDDFTNVYVPKTVFEDRSCVLGTVQNGPKHNQIPDPATLPHEDNNSMWVPDFSPAHYDKMLYTKEGITERVRKDLTGPDGKPGVDISGRTMHNMYLEMSKGAYTVDGQASPWITVPHSEGWYAASRCFKDENGNWVAGREQSMNGHPDNPQGAGRLATDAVDALAKMDPNFPWADYDIEDQGDADGDGNVNEPDGVIDHLVLVHANQGKSRGGGDVGVYSVWAHSSTVAGGYTIPGTNKKVANYIVQPEDAGVGVFAHEFGHDLGLPDLYDTSGNADSDVDFWDLMASGSHSGEIFQALPTHMGLWDKWVLGWADPLQLNPGDDPRSVQLGQTSNTPVGTKDGIKVNLPDKVITLAQPHSGSNMWYSGADQDWADVKLSRTVTVPNAADAKFWMWNNYVIEADWDYGFLEVSTNGGTTWSEQKVYDATGKLVTTNDGYADPNGRMVDFGNKKYGLTGSTGGWRHDYVDLSAYAGQTIQVRLRYATDEAFVERGWFADDFSVTGGGATTWSDDVEGGANGWTQTGGTFTDTTGAGWHVDSGTQTKAHYYLAEWRNFDGFDKGLKYAYDTVYSHEAWKVDKLSYNAPGMLVWYRDTVLGDVNHVTGQMTALPSYGAKGGLLIVDSHNDPLRRQGEAAVKDPSTLDNLPSRPQSSNAAFSLGSTYPFKECLEAANEPYSEYCTNFAAQAPVPAFTDAKGWYPGIEIRNGSAFARDNDASVVIPSRGNAKYTTRVTNPDGTPAPAYYGATLGGGAIVLGTGNPGDAGVAYGVSITIKRAAADNSYATVYVTPATP
ncbi:M6 family metalloprotease domain-containing protein [Micromonospora terminaliae]|uniref:M6 family metalloprotease domain-containing protein n=1 Tax=Micromonospora terminaliae TaxID=1914461 RepID=A0AAJ2ZA40_9ACTN|nr:immune inhibitor A domain-containing protein [Micromonospora terminaliae]NES26262.1 M6 family metalloprotease domain-containing protein [Micromonospora terminaliae]QGL50449.1 M6 family metalloprotease domain-containing protein [Micromonospora terminaliae]